MRIDHRGDGKGLHGGQNSRKGSESDSKELHVGWWIHEVGLWGRERSYKGEMRRNEKTGRDEEAVDAGGRGG